MQLTTRSVMLYRPLLPLVIQRSCSYCLIMAQMRRGSMEHREAPILLRSMECPRYMTALPRRWNHWPLYRPRMAFYGPQLFTKHSNSARKGIGSGSEAVSAWQRPGHDIKLYISNIQCLITVCPSSRKGSSSLINPQVTSHRPRNAQVLRGRKRTLAAKSLLHSNKMESSTGIKVRIPWYTTLPIVIIDMFFECSYIKGSY